MDKRKSIALGILEVSIDYINYTQEEKNLLCDNLIDALLQDIDKHLDPSFDRLKFLDEVFESSLITNEQMELYEICEVIKDCRIRLND